MEKFRKTFQIHTNVLPIVCPECDKNIGGGDVTGTPIYGAINHMLEHGWQLLHIGAEWGKDSDGKSISHTVVFLGKS